MDSDVQKIKDRLTIIEVIGQYVTLRRAGRNYTARCPFHKERTPSFMVSPERGTYICFGCGEKGDVFSFIQKMDGIDFPSALRLLAERAGVKLEQKFSRPPEQKEKEEKLREVCEASVEFFELELKRRKDVQNYLKTRGLKEETIQSWRLGYAPASWEDLARYLAGRGFAKDLIVEAGFAVRSEKKPGEIFDRFRGRIIFPMFDVAGQPIAVSGRFFEKVQGSKEEGEPAKYVNSPETALFRKSRVLYGFDRARNFIRNADCILLVEGQFDLLLSHQSGLPFSVALSGTALTHEHLSLLSRLSKRLVLALDADSAGLRSGLKSAHMALTAGFDVKIPTFPEGKDPADMARENPELLKAAVRTSRSAVEFFLDALRPHAKDELAYKKVVQAQVLPLIQTMGSAIEQEHFDRIVGARLGTSAEAVRAVRAKLPAAPLQDEPSSPETHEESAESVVTPLERKVGMLLSYFGYPSDIGARLEELLGREQVERMHAASREKAEELRFRFEQELGDHTSEETIAGDMFEDVRKAVERERFKMKFL